MTFDEWIDQFPDDEKESVCLLDSWRAGARAMVDALVERGFIGCQYADLAKERTAEISGEVEQ